MKIYKNPKKSDWNTLAKRPVLEQQKLDAIVADILNDVKINEDKALFKYAEKFDGVKLNTLKVEDSEIETATTLVSQDLKNAINIAKQNIEIFHKSQQVKEQIIETTKGVKCWRKSVGIEKVGLYIPGGSAPLFSTILMLGIPAKLAGCKEIVLCSPPNKDGKINPAILYTANLVGISKIYKVGGAQAIAAMANGTETIPLVYKIFGPGNQYVTKAKELIQQQGIAIDMPAGPSEVLVIADQTSNPEFVAADLLSQAEHGVDSQVILLSDNEDIINKTIKALDTQLNQLSRKNIASEALKVSRAILLDSINQCIEFSNLYAPEHLIISTDNALDYIESITNAGSVFLGKYSCESAGDYASGTNHTLPTNGYAKNYSGVSLDSFVKKITFQNLNKEGIKNIGPAIELMAEAEGLDAHKNAVSLRLKAINNV
jgi:histidinol dehydrogenase